MRQLIFALFFILGIVGNYAEAVTRYEEIYPYLIQQIEGTATYKGDSHGDFQGDLVAILTDGSAWKIHPSQTEIYLKWNVGNQVHIKSRTSFYWFRRQHKFELYNHDKQESVKVMLIKHIDNPGLLTIVNTETYIKNYSLETETELEYYWENGQQKTRVVAKHVWKPVYRKTIVLSDGSMWVIKRNIDDFTIGSRVYVGVQARPEEWYDFVLIVGTEREARWTFARPHR